MTALLVKEAVWEADGVLSLRLVDPGGAALPPWEPGAHVDVRLPSGLLRQYSLCGDPGDAYSYRIAVLRVEDGRGGSREVHQTGLVGRELEILGPRNHFALAPAPRYLFLAGGVGITPILSMVRAVAAQGLPWELHYGGRAKRSMAFLPELAQLADSGQVHLVPEEEDGRLKLAAIIGGVPPETAVYCCGPEGMIRAVLAERADAHIERFAAAATVAAAATSDEDRLFTVELRRSQLVLEVPAGRPMLDVILDAVPDIAFSCQEGYCGSCETRVLAGTPDHRDQVLTDTEREHGDTMMICVGRSHSPLLVLDL